MIDATGDRPKDIHGQPVELGPWYWAKNRTGHVVGVGKFLSPIAGHEVNWFINGTGYGPSSFSEFVKADEPKFATGEAS